MDQPDPTLYDLLAVSPTSSPTELRRAWRQTARRLHPDTGTDPNPEAFISAHDAYETLIDPLRRRFYDAELARTGRAFGSGPAFTNQTFSDTPAEATSPHSPSDIPVGPRGADLRVQLTIDFAAAVFGSSSTLTLSRREVCSACAGLPPEMGCPVCGFTGTELREARVAVTIPPGTESASTLTMYGAGDVGTRLTTDEPGSTGTAAFGLPGPPGDMFVTVNVRPRADVVMRGRDLIYDLPVDVVDALLGVRLSTTLLDGPATIVVPPGTAPATRIKLAGRGVPLPGATRGDAYVEVRLLMRTALSAAQRDLLLELRRLDLEKPAAHPGL